MIQLHLSCKHNECISKDQISGVSPYVHSVFHHCHVRLALGRGVDGKLRRWDDKAFAQWQPHPLSQGVCKSATDMEVRKVSTWKPGAEKRFQKAPTGPQTSDSGGNY